MLVLSRHVNESIIIGDDIVVTIVAIRDDIISIGVQAPLDVPIYRQELWDRLDRERREQEERGGTA